MTKTAALLQSVEGEPLTLLGVEARGTVDGLLTELEVTQRYRNGTPVNIEAVYTFPLPFGAVLLGVDVRIGERMLAGVVVEKVAAQARYEAALDAGNSALLLERAGDGLCTINLGNLLAGESASVCYRYAQLLDFAQGSVRLTVPTVIAPRYGTPVELAPHQVPSTDLRAAYPFSLEIMLRGALCEGRIASPTHPITFARDSGAVRVSLSGGARLDRDFVLNVDELPAESLVVVGRDGDGYVALASVCAAAPSDASGQSLRLKILVDCSGSMGGDSIAAARRALHRVLESLTPRDRVSLSRFGSSVVHAVQSLLPASTGTIRRLASSVAALEADLGGTEMESALSSVFELDREAGAADVLLVTDGETWAADALVARARNAGQRVFAIGIGSAPAESVLRRVAEATGGASEMLAPREAAEPAILRMFARLRAPRIAHATVAWPTPPTWTVSPPVGIFGGETVHLMAGFDTQPAGEVGVALHPAGDSAPIGARVRLPQELSASPTVARIAAARRMERLPEAEQLALALRHSLLTALTSFVVVHERSAAERSTELPALRTVAQMHAAGWGGVGSVREFAPCPPPPMSGSPGPVRMDPKRVDMFAVLGSLSIASGKHAPAAADRPAPLAGLLRTLDRAARALWPDYRLPETLDELEQAGIPAATRAWLEALVREGHEERYVVRAYLESLAAHAEHLGASRQLLRRLRHLFRSPDDCRPLRAAVALALEPGDARIVMRALAALSA